MFIDRKRKIRGDVRCLTGLRIPEFVRVTTSWTSNVDRGAQTLTEDSTVRTEKKKKRGVQATHRPRSPARGPRIGSTCKPTNCGSEGSPRGSRAAFSSFAFSPPRSRARCRDPS